LEAYDRDGFVILENLLSPSDYNGVIEEYEGIIRERANKLKAEGKLYSTFEEEPFQTRFVKLTNRAPDITRGLDIMQVRGPEIFKFLHNPKMLDVMESIFGPELLCSPIQHVRIVPPTNAMKSQSVGAAYSWHQDYAVCWPEADGHLIAGFWIPLVDVTIDSGCLEAIPGSHKLGPLPHRKVAEVEVVPDAVPKSPAPVPFPLKAGSALLLRNYIVHHARPNTSNGIRWSLDLRYQHPYTPTGRPFYPSFIVRSKMKPEAVLNDFQVWNDRWKFALASTEGVRMYARWGTPNQVTP
jgi:ectoine hydroxylase-related dioxygenase (phytanoyl-CoA dioxygenase family)